MILWYVVWYLQVEKGRDFRVNSMWIVTPLRSILPTIFNPTPAARVHDFSRQSENVAVSQKLTFRRESVEPFMGRKPLVY